MSSHPDPLADIAAALAVGGDLATLDGDVQAALAVRSSEVAEWLAGWPGVARSVLLAAIRSHPAAAARALGRADLDDSLARAALEGARLHGEVPVLIAAYRERRSGGGKLHPLVQRATVDAFRGAAHEDVWRMATHLPAGWFDPATAADLVGVARHDLAEGSLGRTAEIEPLLSHAALDDAAMTDLAPHVALHALPGWLARRGDSDGGEHSGPVRTILDALVEVGSIERPQAQTLVRCARSMTAAERAAVAAAVARCDVMGATDALRETFMRPAGLVLDRAQVLAAAPADVITAAWRARLDGRDGVVAIVAGGWTAAHRAELLGHLTQLSPADEAAAVDATVAQLAREGGAGADLPDPRRVLWNVEAWGPLSTMTTAERCLLLEAAAAVRSDVRPFKSARMALGVDPAVIVERFTVDHLAAGAVADDEVAAAVARRLVGVTGDAAGTLVSLLGEWESTFTDLVVVAARVRGSA